MSSLKERVPQWRLTPLQLVVDLAGALVIGLVAGYLVHAAMDPADRGDHVHDEVPAVHQVHSGERRDGVHSGNGTASAAPTTYTCSMHPQIQRGEPGDCPICGMDLIPLEAGSNDDPAVLTMSEAAVAMARVQTTEVVAADGSAAASAEASRLTVSGRLAADERLAATQTAHVPGRIERLLVGFEGEVIRSGQKIAEVYSPDLVAAQRELLEAERLAADTDSPLAATASSLREAALTKLRNLRVDQATIDRVLAGGEPVSTFPIYAEAGGTVTDKRVEVGDYVIRGEVLYTLTKLDELWALFDVYEEQLASVRVGDRVSFTTPAAPGQNFSARVSFIDPSIDPATRTGTVRAEVPNRNGRLKPDMLIRGELELRPSWGSNSTDGGAVRVPATAVLWTGDRSVVYVELPDASVPSYAFREVALGARIGDDYLVNDGLALGERVVTRGAFSIDAAAQLNNQFSMMNRDVVIQGREAAAVTQVVLPDYREDTPVAFQEALAVLAKAYLPIKDALVASDLATAKTAHLGFGASLKEVDMRLVSGDAHDYWMGQLRALQTHGDQLASATDLEQARTQFAFFSQALVNAVTVFGLPQTPDVHLYVEHCPMALQRDNGEGAPLSSKGANWLSDEPIIRNPYFGDRMLTCGSVTDTLLP